MIGMYSSVKFDRKIDLERHYFSPGGYNMTFNGKEFCFDFTNSWRSVDGEDPTVMHFEQECVDMGYCPEAASLTSEDVRKLEEITEFYIYANGDGCPEIHPVKLLALSFEFNDGEVVDCTDMDAVKNFRFD